MSEEQLPFAGCPFPLDLTCVDAEAWNDFDPAVQALATALATASLRSLTAYRVGGCPITVRPCRDGGCQPVSGPYGGYWMRPGLTQGGQWVNNCGCGPSCQHDPRTAVTLPAPVGRVDSIKVDGTEKVLSDFRLDNGNILVYQGDDGFEFPTAQDLRLADTEVGTWSVTYLNAIVPDVLAAQAAARLAFEFAVACGGSSAGNRKCKLPNNVVALTRTGVSMEFKATAWPGGLTGVNEVDAWIFAVNPTGRKGQTRVLSLDLPGPVIQGRSL